MLNRVSRRKKIDSHELQSLRNVVKRGGDTVIKDFENTFQEIIVEGKREKTTSVHYTDSGLDNDDLSEGEYTKEELETLYMGTSSKARTIFKRSRSFQRRQPFGRQRSFSQDSNFPPRRPRNDGVDRCDRSRALQSSSQSSPQSSLPQYFPRCITC